MEKQLKEQIKKLEKENKKLKSLADYNYKLYQDALSVCRIADDMLAEYRKD